jgi:hypothetical protein
MEERRKAEEESTRMKNLQVNEINFPTTLGSSEWTAVPTTRKWGHTTFAALAETWSSKEEEERKRREDEEYASRRELAEIEEIRRRRRNLSYNFGTAHSRREDTYYEDCEDDEPREREMPPRDDWTTVTKKPKKERSQLDYSYSERPTTPVENSNVWDDRAYEDTAWGNH